MVKRREWDTFIHEFETFNPLTEIEERIHNPYQTPHNLSVIKYSLTQTFNSIHPSNSNYDTVVELIRQVNAHRRYKDSDYTHYVEQIQSRGTQPTEDINTDSEDKNKDTDTPDIAES